MKSSKVKLEEDREASYNKCFERLSNTGSILKNAKSKLLIVEPTILKARTIFEGCKIPSEGYAEESQFQSKLRKTFGEKASSIFEGLLSKTLLIKVRDGFLKWSG